MNEDEENIIPENEDDSNETSGEAINEGFDDIKVSGGNHFYENNDSSEDTITKVTGMYKDWFLD